MRQSDEIKIKKCKILWQINHKFQQNIPITAFLINTRSGTNNLKIIKQVIINCVWNTVISTEIFTAVFFKIWQSECSTSSGILWLYTLWHSCQQLLYCTHLPQVQDCNMINRRLWANRKSRAGHLFNVTKSENVTTRQDISEYRPALFESA